MTVPFKQIPDTLRTPLFFAEVDNSRANTAIQATRALIIGQITSAGTAVANVPVLSQGAADAKVVGGAGSMLWAMVDAYRANDPFGELWLLPLADDGGGVAATGSIVFTGPTTAAGVLDLYIAGQKLSLALASGTSASAAATAVAAAINANTDLPVTATPSTGTVNLTAVHKGECGNEIDIRVNYLGAAGGEVTPAGLGVAVTAMANGATNPVLTTALANLADEPYDVIISPFVDSTSIAAITALLNDVAGRWSWSTQIYGHCVIAKRANTGGLATFGATLNDQHLTAIGIYDAPSPNYRWAAAFGAAIAVSVRADPAQPLHSIAIEGLLAPPMSSRFTLSQRNTLLYEGISTFTVQSDGSVVTEGIITSYQKNTLGQPDNSYLKAETMFNLMTQLRRLALAVSVKFARVKLATDGTRVLPGSNVVTPAIIKAELIATYAELVDAGLAQNPQEFAAGLIVEKNASNPNRVDVLFPTVLINQLDTFAVLAQFRLY